MRRFPLAVLSLEDRTVPAIFGVTTGFAVGEDTFDNRIAAAANPAGPSATMVSAIGAVEQSFPLGAEFTGGVRVARADFTGDGIDDLLVGSGPGVPARVRVYDGSTRAQLIALQPFEETFTGGVFVAAGDLNGDNRPDVVVTPDQGGGPRIAGYDGTLRIGTALTRHAFPDFFAYEQTLRNGAFVAVGDVNGDRIADVITGAGPGGAPRVKAFNGRELFANRQTTIADFFAGDTTTRGGVRVAAKDLDGDFQTDLVTGVAPTAGRTITTYAGRTLGQTNPPVLRTFEAFTTGSFADGVFVG